MHVAARHGDADLLARMIQHGADVNTATFDGCTALHAAAGHVESKVRVDDLINMLVEAGASVDALDEDGYTPLHLACAKGDPLRHTRPITARQWQI